MVYAYTIPYNKFEIWLVFKTSITKELFLASPLSSDKSIKIKNKLDHLESNKFWFFNKWLTAKVVNRDG